MSGRLRHRRVTINLDPIDETDEDSDGAQTVKAASPESIAAGTAGVDSGYTDLSLEGIRIRDRENRNHSGQRATATAQAYQDTEMIDLTGEDDDSGRE